MISPPRDFGMKSRMLDVIRHLNANNNYTSTFKVKTLFKEIGGANYQKHLNELKDNNRIVRTKSHGWVINDNYYK